MWRSETSTDQMTAVRHAVDRLLAGEVGTLLDLLADDVHFEVAAGGDPGNAQSGKQAVADYFAGLRGLVAFWQLDYTAAGDQVIGWGKERFTIGGCGLEGACELALVFDIEDGTISRLLVVEDLRSFKRAGCRVTDSATAWAGRRRHAGHRPGRCLRVTDSRRQPGSIRSAVEVASHRNARLAPR